MLTRMGVHVHLAVATDRVSDAAWRKIYEKARHVASLWVPRPLGIAWRNIGVVRVVQYTPHLETTEGLHIVGDMESLRIGESFVFPATLAHACVRRVVKSSPAPSHDDALVAVAAEQAGKKPTVNVLRLLGAKTQGLPYHVLMVALGLLVENAFPGTAVVYGDISTRDGEQARDGLASILGEKFELPVAVDVARLRRRLASTMNAAAISKAVKTLAPPADEAVQEELLRRLRSIQRARVSGELEIVAPTCRNPGELQPGTQQVFCALIETIHSNVARWNLRHQVRQWGAARAREAIVQKCKLRLTAMAWDAIEAADLDELAFLLGATFIDTLGWNNYHGVRAILENRTLRQLAGHDRHDGSLAAPLRPRYGPVTPRRQHSTPTRSCRTIARHTRRGTRSPSSTRG